MEPRDSSREARERELDALISAPGRTTPQATLDAELIPLTRAAERLASVRNELPAVPFANALEQRLMALVGERISSPHVPSSTQATRTQGAMPRIGPQPAHSIPHMGWRVWSAVAAGLVLALALGGSIAAASAGPDSALYGVRRFEEGVRANLSGSAAEKARLHLQYATEALNALDALVTHRGSNSAYAQALRTFTEEFVAAQDTVTIVSAGDGHDALASQLDALRMRGTSDLHTALPTIGLPLRVESTKTLAQLGDQVIQITSVKRSHPKQGSHDWTVTISGSGFQPGATVLIGGRTTAALLTFSSTSITMQLSGDGTEQSLHGLIVENPDYTAATISSIASDDGSQNDGSSDSHNDPHASPTATPGKDGDNRGGPKGTPTPGPHTP